MRGSARRLIFGNPERSIVRISHDGTGTRQSLAIELSGTSGRLSLCGSREFRVWFAPTPRVAHHHRTQDLSAFVPKIGPCRPLITFPSLMVRAFHAANVVALAVSNGFAQHARAAINQCSNELGSVPAAIPG
jgi:hypothetical protein